MNRIFVGKGKSLALLNSQFVSVGCIERANLLLLLQLAVFGKVWEFW